MIITNAIQVLAGLIGSIGFAVLFNIRGKRLVASSIGGGLSWLLYLLLNTYISNEAVNYFIVSFIISVYAEIMARLLKTPTTTFITVSLIPLIPGASLYYTMAHAFDGNYSSFLQKGLLTLQLASSLALGIILATAFARIINNLFSSSHKGHTFSYSKYQKNKENS